MLPIVLLDSLGKIAPRLIWVHRTPSFVFRRKDGDSRPSRAQSVGFDGIIEAFRGARPVTAWRRRGFAMLRPCVRSVSTAKQTKSSVVAPSKRLQSLEPLSRDALRIIKSNR